MMAEGLVKGRALVLASASPARLELLRDLGYDVAVFPTRIQETLDSVLPGPAAKSLAKRKLLAYLAARGADAGPGSVPGARGATGVPGAELAAATASLGAFSAVPILACDTLIWFENRIIGKPRSTEEAMAHLRGFSGRTHQVFTGYALWADGRMATGWDMAEVAFREIGDEEIKMCLRTGEHQGAAGSYRIQGFAARFVEEIRGDWATVVGVPVKKLGLQAKWTRTNATAIRTKPRI